MAILELHLQMKDIKYFDQRLKLNLIEVCDNVSPISKDKTDSWVILKIEKSSIEVYKILPEMSENHQVSMIGFRTDTEVKDNDTIIIAHEGQYVEIPKDYRRYSKEIAGKIDMKETIKLHKELYKKVTNKIRGRE